jgi:hypothetical protein
VIQARIHQGRIEANEPIPEHWEGRIVKVQPLAPDDSCPDLEERLATLESLGPMEFDSDEREQFLDALRGLDEMSRDDLLTKEHQGSSRRFFKHFAPRTE